MRRFLFWLFFFTILGAFGLYFEWDVPYVSTWFGTLPGDILLKEKGMIYCAPLTSAALFSIVICFLFSLLPSKN